MKNGRPLGGTADLPTSNIGIVAPHPQSLNDERPAGVPAPIAAVRPIAEDEIDRLLAELDQLDSRPTSETSNFVKRVRPKPSRGQRFFALRNQGVEASEVTRLLDLEFGPLSVRGATPHPIAPHTAKILTDENQAKPPAPIDERVKRHPISDARLAAYHDQIARLGHPVAVTIRLRSDIEAKAMNIGREGGEPLEWLRRRINRELAKIPGAVLGSVWVAGIKSRGGDALHLHGEIAVADLDQLPAISEAILRAAGRSPKRGFRRRQVKFKLHPNAGWLAYYCDQNASEAHRAGIPGKLMVASGNLKSITTKAMADRKKVLRQKARRASKACQEIPDDLPNIPATETSARPPVRRRQRLRRRRPLPCESLRSRRLRRPPRRAWNVRGHLDRGHRRSAPGDHAGRLRPRGIATGPPVNR